MFFAKSDRLTQRWLDSWQAAHPGFVISFDNLDIHLDRKNMTMESQNKDFHWVNHQMVENRVSGVMLDSSAPKANLLDVCNLKYLPSIEDQRCQRLNYIILCSRILVDYFDVLAPLANACIQHIPHKYTNELSQKTKKVCFRSVLLESSQNLYAFITQIISAWLDQKILNLKNVYGWMNLYSLMKLHNDIKELITILCLKHLKS